MSCMWLRQAVHVFFEYETPKIVHIESKKVGVISRLVQALILTYIVGYVIVYQKGYQQFDNVESAVTTKLKGVAYTNYSDQELIGVPSEWKHLYRRVWDVTDYVVPPSENNAFFVTTNVIITPDQKQGVCPEDPHLPGAACDPVNNTCRAGDSLALGHGVNTGECVPVQETQLSLNETEPGAKELFSCQVRAWCPIEKDSKPLGKQRALLSAAENFTVLIKNQIEFPLYSKQRSNILESSNQSYLQNCLYDEETDPFCPVFRLGTIVRLAGEEFDKLAVNGAVVSIVIHWDCDLDYDFMKHCRPQYQFRRLDSPKTKIAPGWNFRHSDYFNTSHRTLYKSYGILFLLDVQGRGGKFSFIPFAINLGAGLALLGVATIICDVIVLYLMKDRRIYRDNKYCLVKGSDAYEVVNRSHDQQEQEEQD